MIERTLPLCLPRLVVVPSFLRETKKSSTIPELDTMKERDKVYRMKSDADESRRSASQKKRRFKQAIKCKQ